MKPVKHVAIIMDGNGRWGIKKKKSWNAGHSAGISTVESIIKETIKNKIKYLTLYAFSTENWKRPKREIDFLFNLLEEFLIKKINLLNKNGIKLRIIGDKKELPKNSNIFWPSNNKCPDKVYDILKSNCFNIDKKIVYKNCSIDCIDIKSSNLIKKNQISVVLFFSLRSTEMWIELINKSNLFKFLLSVNFVVINEEVSKYLKELKFKNVSVSRRKRRASVLSLGMKVFNNLEIL